MVNTMGRAAVFMVAVLVLLSGGLALGQPAPAPDPGAAARSSLPAGAFEQKLREGRALANDRKYADACAVFSQIMRVGSDVERYFKEAEFELGVNLYKLGFFQSAFLMFERIADAGSSHPHYVDTLRWLLHLQRKMPGDQATLEKLASYDPEAYPDDIADEVAYLAGQYWYNEMDLDQALTMLARVRPATADVYLRARFLTGVAHVRRNQAKPALEAFKDVLRFAPSSGLGREERERYEQLAYLTLARVFYSTRQYATAIRYYDRVERFGPYWLDALGELSWTYFQLNNFPKALGNLHTLNSPYFEDQYLPESLVLQAVILFTNCKYEDTLQTVDHFIKEYWEVKKELETQLSSYTDPNEFYAFLARLSRKGSDFSLKLKRIFNAALADNRLRRQLGFVVQLNQELEGLQKLTNYAPAKYLADQMVGEIMAYRELVIGNAGELARARLERVHRELKELLAQALKVKYETLNAQKNLIEAGAGDAAGRGVVVAEPAVDAEHQRWPFRGEYWKDELDSYFFIIQSECRE